MIDERHPTFHEDRHRTTDKIIRFLSVHILRTATFVMFVFFVLMKIDVLPPSFEHSPSVIAIGLVYVAAMGVILNLMAFTKVKSGLKFIALPGMVFIDLLILLVLGGLLIEWLVK